MPLVPLVEDVQKKDDQFWVSHSKMEVARQCMKKFKFKYIDKVEGKKEDTTPEDFGSCMHEIAEKYRGGGKEELLALYHSLVPSKFIIGEKYRNKIPIALKNIFQYYKKFAEGKETYPELDAKFEFEDGIVLNGKIDLLIENDGRFRVTDYKTKKSYKYYDPKEQLAMYMLLLNKKYGIPFDKMDTEIVYISLDSEDKYGNKIPNQGLENIQKCYKVTKEDCELLIREIKVLKKRIEKGKETGEWKANPTEFNCKYCEYCHLCEDNYFKSLA